MNKSTRMLSAVMFADLVGYTKLMQNDEKKAIANRDRHRAVLEKSVAKFSGKIVQYYGDGSLTIFNSAIEAVKCGVEIQKTMQDAPAIPLRVGLHLGDIVQDSEGIYGDGVNVAARIEALAVPGSVLISDRIKEQLINHPELTANSLGKHKLKNVNRDLEIFAIKTTGIYVPTTDEIISTKSTEIKSIAVLPFVNMSADPDNEYFSDGITEELLNALARVEGLQVTSRTSSFAFKNKNIDVREIGEQLGVKTVLEGSVRKAGNKVRITAQLINTSDGYHIWSNNYNRSLEDIFEVQDEIANKITSTLREKLNLQELNEPIVKAPTKNIEAYNLYLKGIYHLNKWSPEGARTGIKFLNEAIKIAPDFAMAYSMLAFCHAMLGTMGQSKPYEAFAVARENAIKALKIDEEDVGANISMALISVFVDWDLKGAKFYLDKALSVGEIKATTFHAYAIYLWAIHNEEEAIEVMQKAVELDPLSLPFQVTLAEVYYHTNDFKSSFEIIDRILELDSNFRAALEIKGWVHYYSGDIEKAIESFKVYQKATNHPLKGLAGLGFMYGKTGQTDKAQECIDKLKQRAELDKSIMLHMDFAIIYAGLNDSDNYFKYLDKSLKDGSGLVFIKTHKLHDEYRQDPRMNELLLKYGFIDNFEI